MTVYVAFRGLRLHLRVANLEEASRCLAAQRDRGGYGASAMLPGCGDVRDERGELVARVSYNGRIWTPEGEPLDAIGEREWMGRKD